MAHHDPAQLVWRETDGAEYERLRHALSVLRTALTQDLQSRITAPALEGDAVGGEDRAGG